MRLGLIGGSGAAAIVPGDVRDAGCPETLWGTTAAPLLRWTCGSAEIVYIARHGSGIDGSGIAPHRVNYRANVQALRDAGVDAIIGLNAVGGITAGTTPGRLVLPHQLIDYTCGREQTFYDGICGPLRHIEFDPPFDPPLRQRLLAAGTEAGIDLLDLAVYGVTQGPRLETAAEIDRLEADGCDIVGMTAMPEAALARELDLRYAICAVVVNHAAGRLPGKATIHDQLGKHLTAGMHQASRLIDAFCQLAD